MSGDHNQYQKPGYVDRRQWKYDPMTGEPLVDGWPLYSGLPQRKWQGLTDEEKEYYRKLGLVGVEIIEAKLKEKNAPDL